VLGLSFEIIYFLDTEHVGSKTAVQIRSHAQKFFSKVYSQAHVLYHKQNNAKILMAL